MRFPASPIVLALLLAAPMAHAQETLGPPSFHLMGFGDIDYRLTERDVSDGFLVGQIVAHTVAGLSERLTVFSELSMTARASGYNLEVERIILRYAFSDPLKLSIGRYHTPISYWNTAFHHGLWLQTTVGRPEIIKFGGRFLPVHFVGVLAEGNFPALPLGLGYEVGIGNGRGSEIARAGDAGDVNSDRAWVASLRVRPPRLLGVRAGASIYSDQVRVEDGPSITERILSAHVVLERESPEVIIEYVRAAHERADESETEGVSTGYYAQFAYRLPGRAQHFKPYLRVERLDVADQDPLLAPFGLDYEALIVGLRYDFATFAALKAEYRREEFEEPESFDSLYLQASFTIPGVIQEGGTVLMSAGARRTAEREAR